MKSTSHLLLLFLFGTVFAASIPTEPASIPVHIIYDDNDLSEQKIRPQTNINAIKNLDAKPQLSANDLRLINEHLPLNKDQIQDETTFQALGELSNDEVNAQPSAAPESVSTTIQSVAQSVEATTPAATSEGNSNPNLVLLIQIAQQIIYGGIDTLKDTLDRLAANTESRVPPITEEQWDRFNSSVTNLFSSLYETESGKAEGDNPNILQTIVIGFQNATTTFVQRFNRTNTNQNAAGVLTSGLNNIQDNLSSFVNRATTQSTILGESTASPANPVVGGAQNILTQIGQAINSISPFAPARPDAAASDDPNAPPPNPIIQNAQNVLTQFGQAVSSINLNPFQQGATPPPGGQADSPPNPPNSNPIIQGAQNVFSQVGQAINNFQLFSTPKPGAASDEPTGGNNNPIIQGAQNVFNQVGQAINSFITPPKPGGQGDDPGGSTPGNPIVQGAQNLFTQVGQAINNLNPFQGTTQAPLGGGGGGGAPAGNPIEVIGQVVGPINPPAVLPPING